MISIFINFVLLLNCVVAGTVLAIGSAWSADTTLLAVAAALLATNAAALVFNLCLEE
jgi:hypothetical protein